jgi:hypothetical protein
LHILGNHFAKPIKKSNSPKIFIWQLLLSNQEFYHWKQHQNAFILFFDGASAGNPVAAGARGVVFYFGGNKALEFSWGLGNAANNHVETIYMGLCLIPVSRLMILVVIGDLDLIIKGL